MSDSSKRYLIAYDIPEDKRRSRLAKLLESYGYRAQYSVFVVDIRPARAVRLWQQIEALIRAKEDSVLICDLGPAKGVQASRFRYLGCERVVSTDGPIVI